MDLTAAVRVLYGGSVMDHAEMFGFATVLGRVLRRQNVLLAPLKHIEKQLELVQQYMRLCESAALQLQHCSSRDP